MKEYTYIIARIRSLETQLMTAQELDQLIAAPSAADAEKALRDRRRGTDGLWELLIDAEAEHITAFLRMPIDYHNIKAAIKAVFSDTDAEELLLDNGSVDKDVIYESVKKREYNELPDALAETAQAAMTALLRTQDGQICDIITDKAQRAAMEDLAKSSGVLFLARYAHRLA
ncbi:MAG: V-type ATPase subunit, partial [Clostridia bacterium]|nr:V-type ATPase subunit [Clostridia bacterium]